MNYVEIKYYKIRADFKYAEKGRFYRVFLVKENANLREMGEFIVEIFGGELEHMFLYRLKGNRSYLPESWIEDWNFFSRAENEPFNKKTVEDLPDTFTFEYDTGDGWDFNCKIYKKPVIKEIDDDGDIPFGFVLDAKGMGIWEDEIYTLYAYLEGKIDKDFDGEDEENGIYKPWNFEIDKYSEFDDPVDLEELNKTAMNFIPLDDVY
ncbi:MAG: plasmid pRiA4b ORF-3 family protein [Clostridia bacterium]|nr:plasmid pRiA4b ORF-3 family protein [Clostridia bacterium]